METINYLTSIISLLQKNPQAQEIIDTQGLGQELTFGQIGIKDAKAFLKLYDVLGSGQLPRRRASRLGRGRDPPRLSRKGGRRGHPIHHGWLTAP